MPENPVSPAAATITKPTAAPSASSLSVAVGAAQARTLSVPKGIELFDTDSLSSSYFHACIYGETSTRRTSTAARFASKEDTRIILTRRKEQLLPLKRMGYKAALVNTGDELAFAIQHPESLWPEWAARPERTLIIDDLTEGVNMLVEDASVINDRAVRDMRRSYSEAGKNLRESIKIALSKPQHVIAIALAKVRENQISNEESVFPDLPPSMMSLFVTELEYVFYVKKETWKLLTDRDAFVFQDEIEIGGKLQVKTFRREIFAKHKVEIEESGKLLKKEEAMDLADIWRRVKGGK